MTSNPIIPAAARTTGPSAETLKKKRRRARKRADHNSTPAPAASGGELPAAAPEAKPKATTEPPKGRWYYADTQLPHERVARRYGPLTLAMAIKAKSSGTWH